MPFDGSANSQTFDLPKVEDSVSKADLDDPTGLSGCGDRVYTVMSPTDKITLNNATQKY